MSGHPRVVSYLQRALNHEMAAMQQFTLQAALAGSLGLPGFAQDLRAGACEELSHAEAFAAALLAMGVAARCGLTRSFPIGRSREEILRFGMETERQAIRLYAEACAYCESTAEAAYQDLFARVLADEQQHYRMLEKQLAGSG